MTELDFIGLKSVVFTALMTKLDFIGLKLVVLQIPAWHQLHPPQGPLDRGPRGGVPGQEAGPGLLQPWLRVLVGAAVRELPCRLQVCSQGERCGHRPQEKGGGAPRCYFGLQCQAHLNYLSIFTSHLSDQ